MQTLCKYLATTYPLHTYLAVGFAGLFPLATFAVVDMAEEEDCVVEETSMELSSEVGLALIGIVTGGAIAWLGSEGASGSGVDALTWPFLDVAGVS